MSRSIHERFQEIAGELSPALERAISSMAPVNLRKRRELELPVVLCRQIAGQQLSVKAARTIWTRVIHSSGHTPLIEYLAESKACELRACGMSGNKAKAMKAILAAHHSGILDVDRLDTMDHTARSAWLMQIWGVGQWTADMIGISYFADPDIWPAQDVTVSNTLQRLTSRRRKTIRTAERFAPHRTFLALYLWRIADTQSSKG